MNIKNIINFFSKKHVGIAISEGRLQAFEIETKDNIHIDKPLEEVCLYVAKDFWYNKNLMKEIFTYVLNNTVIKRTFFKPIVCIAIPSELVGSEYISTIDEAALESNWSAIYHVENFLCSASGSGVDVTETKKRIYIYSLKELTYVGLIFGGGSYYVRIIEKDREDLTTNDIKENIEKLLKEVPYEIPQVFTKIKFPEGEFREVVRRWRNEEENKIYLSAPSEIKDRLGLNVGKYQIVYLNNQNGLIEGLKEIVSEVAKGTLAKYGP